MTWSYRFIPLRGDMGTPNRGDVESWNALGEAGWELVAMCAGAGGTTTGAVFKRREGARAEMDGEDTSEPVTDPGSPTPAIRGRTHDDDMPDGDPFGLDQDAGPSDPTQSFFFRRK